MPLLILARLAAQVSRSFLLENRLPVQLDSGCGKVLTYSKPDRAYKIWDLHNYRPLYTIRDENIHEIKISPGIMLVIYRKPNSLPAIPLHIRSIETGEILKKFTHLLKQQKIDFIEQFNEKLLAQQQERIENDKRQQE